LNGTQFVFKISGSIKERSQTSSEMGLAINVMGIGQRPIICQVVALCNQSRNCRQGGVPEGAVHKLGN